MSFSLPTTRSAALAVAAGVFLLAVPAVSLAFVVTPSEPEAATEEPAATTEPAAETPAAETPAVEEEPFDAETIARGLEAFKEGGCRSCHGWAANGDREGPTPPGPSLRDSPINYEGIIYTVSCGRLGSEMPYFRREAYRDASVCGLDRDQAGDMMPPRAASLLSEEEIADLAAYIVGYVQGRGDITFDECEDYFGEGASRCSFYLTE